MVVKHIGLSLDYSMSRLRDGARKAVRSFTYIAGLQVGFLGTDQNGSVMDGSILAFHLLILFPVLGLEKQKKSVLK